MKSNSEALTLETTLKQKEAINASEVNGEVIVLDFESGCYFVMNEVATRIWQAIAEEKHVGDIVKEVLEEYEVDYKIGEEQVIQFISQLMEKELVAVG